MSVLMCWVVTSCSQIGTLSHAQAKLALPKAQYIPCAASVMAAPIEWQVMTTDHLL